MTGYHQHRVTSITPAAGNWEPIEIQEVNGGSTWNIYYNWNIENGDNVQSIAINNPGYSENMTTGVESTSKKSSLSNSYSSGLDYWDPSSGWHNTWGGGAPQCDNPAFSGWVSGQQDHEIYDGM